MSTYVRTLDHIMAGVFVRAVLRAQKPISRSTRSDNHTQYIHGRWLLALIHHRVQQQEIPWQKHLGQHDNRPVPIHSKLREGWLHQLHRLGGRRNPATWQLQFKDTPTQSIRTCVHTYGRTYVRTNN